MGRIDLFKGWLKLEATLVAVCLGIYVHMHAHLPPHVCALPLSKYPTALTLP